MKEVVISPFKFLNAFEKTDIELFFGRKNEVDKLYEMSFDTRLIIFFGASGTGKTSIVQCGLANRFPETRWQELYIRRGKDINVSLKYRIQAEVEKAGGDAGHLEDPVQGLIALHQQTFKPIFITLDQFEELFLLQPDATEQVRFFQFLEKLLATPLACKIIIVIREEFIANLWDFEYLIPGIFDNRFRIKQLEDRQLEMIVDETLQQLEKKGQIATASIGEIGIEVLKKMNAGRSGVGLTYLQVFLDRLYKEAWKSRGMNSIPLLTPAIVQKMGTIDDVIDKFLDEEIAKLEEELGPDKNGIPIRILGEMVSDDKTKKVLEATDMESVRLKYGLTPEEMNTCLNTFETMRIIKRYES